MIGCTDTNLQIWKVVRLQSFKWQSCKFILKLWNVLGKHACMPKSLSSPFSTKINQMFNSWATSENNFHNWLMRELGEKIVWDKEIFNFSFPLIYYNIFYTLKLIIFFQTLLLIIVSTDYLQYYYNLSVSSLPSHMPGHLTNWLRATAYCSLLYLTKHPYYTLFFFKRT